jgi:hypothetical protein
VVLAFELAFIDLPRWALLLARVDSDAHRADF